MFIVDHLMIEVDDPLESAGKVADRPGLPFAWPLMVRDEHTSIGVNFGDINFVVNALMSCYGLYRTGIIAYINFGIGQLASSSVALLFMYAFMSP